MPISAFEDVSDSDVFKELFSSAIIELETCSSRLSSILSLELSYPIVSDIDSSIFPDNYFVVSFPWSALPTWNPHTFSFALRTWTLSGDELESGQRPKIQVRSLVLIFK